jgi:antagonist of KipI
MIRVLKPGILSSLQDIGRPGYRAWGIGPGGAMDRYALASANRLVRNKAGEACLEIHFPAPALLFEQEAEIAVTGADFAPHINGVPVAPWTSLYISAGQAIEFRAPRQGARAYLSLRGGFTTKTWLGSASTDLQTGLGGQRLQKDDVLQPGHAPNFDWRMQHWPDANSVYIHGLLPLLPGPEWNWLDARGHEQLESAVFSIRPESNRTGFRLQGPALNRCYTGELISCPVSMGTVQLLPDGQLIILMADHPTTGGYPRVAQVPEYALPTLAQYTAGRDISFQLTTLAACMASQFFKTYLSWT